MSAVDLELRDEVLTITGPIRTALEILTDELAVEGNHYEEIRTLLDAARRLVNEAHTRASALHKPQLRLVRAPSNA